MTLLPLVLVLFGPPQAAGAGKPAYTAVKLDDVSFVFPKGWKTEKQLFDSDRALKCGSICHFKAVESPKRGRASPAMGVSYFPWNAPRYKTMPDAECQWTKIGGLDAARAELDCGVTTSSCADASGGKYARQPLTYEACGEFMAEVRMRQGVGYMYRLTSKAGKNYFKVLYAPAGSPGAYMLDYTSLPKDTERHRPAYEKLIESFEVKGLD